MISPALIRIIESKELIDILVRELTQNLGTSHYRRLHQDDLYSRISVVYLHLGQWLQTKDEATLRKNAEELGRKRFSEGVPLGQVVLALILNEKHLWKLLEKAGQPLPEAERKTVTEFFQKHTYYTGNGYEEALSESNALSKKQSPDTQGQVSVGIQEPPRKVAGKTKQEQDINISRGGQVGEHGG